MLPGAKLDICKPYSVQVSTHVSAALWDVPAGFSSRGGTLWALPHVASLAKNSSAAVLGLLHLCGAESQSPWGNWEVFGNGQCRRGCQHSGACAEMGAGRKEAQATRHLQKDALQGVGRDGEQSEAASLARTGALRGLSAPSAAGQLLPSSLPGAVHGVPGLAQVRCWQQTWKHYL